MRCVLDCCASRRLPRPTYRIPSRLILPISLSTLTRVCACAQTRTWSLNVHLNGNEMYIHKVPRSCNLQTTQPPRSPSPWVDVPACSSAHRPHCSIPGSHTCWFVHASSAPQVEFVLTRNDSRANDVEVIHQVRSPVLCHLSHTPPQLIQPSLVGCVIACCRHQGRRPVCIVAQKGAALTRCLCGWWHALVPHAPCLHRHRFATPAMTKTPEAPFSAPSLSRFVHDALSVHPPPPFPPLHVLCQREPIIAPPCSHNSSDALRLLMC